MNGVKLEAENDENCMCPSAMQDGQIGTITGHRDPEYIGRVVQAFGDKHLVTIGRPAGKAWDNRDKLNGWGGFTVRILKPGEKLVIQ